MTLPYQDDNGYVGDGNLTQQDANAAQEVEPRVPGLYYDWRDRQAFRGMKGLFG